MNKLIKKGAIAAHKGKSTVVIDKDCREKAVPGSYTARYRKWGKL